MTKYLRKFTCAICGFQVIYDDKRCVLSCKCGEHGQQLTEKEISDNFWVLNEGQIPAK